VRCDLAVEVNRCYDAIVNRTAIVNEEALTNYIRETFEGVDVVRPGTSGGPEIAWGDTFFIYDPHRDLEPKHCFPFATIVTKDYEGFDEASHLNRPGVFRLNIAVRKESYRVLFGQAAAGGEQTGKHDFSAVDQLLPHPIYSRQSWVCMLNPTTSVFQRSIVPLLAEAYQLSRARFEKTHSSAASTS
jgi:hypothetical protein